MNKVKVKICGITNFEDAKLAVHLGAWALGFVFWPHSPRYIKPRQVAKIIADLREIKLLPEKLVGVFVNPTIKELEDAERISGITTFQLHGDESPEFCKRVNGEVIKALRLQDEEDLIIIRHYCSSFYFLIDAAVQGQYGGTGTTANWPLAKKLGDMGPVILSGGLNESNVLEAMAIVTPFALDLSSGVERKPGKKSPDKLKNFFKILDGMI